jgi:Zn-dependent peptidase ImmA (M78 family)
VEQIASILGICVQFEPADDEPGFLLRDLNRQKATTGVNDRHSEHRKRFTIAHELGHDLLHEQEKPHVDRQSRINWRDGTFKKGESDAEKEASLFAVELLMPVHFIQQDSAEAEAFDLESDATISELAKAYKVSS